ncbi:hypothetical protein NPIL_119281 [Nephila pilipes]|uniref:Uncharacterized protein n=1 Tax=Nephila pilipes TaxID=299642 RepID=A0A8X6MAZ0_NEPPI|nr:hypothetical protein NPIL_119281 [Nephila pilipes]
MFGMRFLFHHLLSVHQTSLEGVHPHPKSIDSWPSNAPIVLPPMAHLSGWPQPLDKDCPSEKQRKLFVNKVFATGARRRVTWQKIVAFGGKRRAPSRRR